VVDVEEGGVPVLTQRLPLEADDELADLAAQLDQVCVCVMCVCV
jgi:hypothetical protein